MDESDKKIVNYYILMNVSIQFMIVPKLNYCFNLTNERNILFYRKPFFKKAVLNKHSNLTGWDEIHGIPFFQSKTKLILWINFIIYILYFFLYKPKTQCNLIIGNYLYNGNRSICNLLNKYWIKIFILDEGLSTVKVVEDRSEIKKQNNKLSYFNKLLKSGHPERQLIFYTNFNLRSNDIDIIHQIEEQEHQAIAFTKTAINTVFVIGTYLAESKTISIAYFCKLLEKIKQFNQDKNIFYIAHPKETIIFNLTLEQLGNITILRPEINVEQFLINLEEIPEIIASTFSTAYVYVGAIFKQHVKYQTFICKSEEILITKKVKEINELYQLIHKHLDGYDVQEYIV